MGRSLDLTHDHFLFSMAKPQYQATGWSTLRKTSCYPSPTTMNRFEKTHWILQDSEIAFCYLHCSTHWMHRFTHSSAINPSPSRGEPRNSQNWKDPRAPSDPHCGSRPTRVHNPEFGIGSTKQLGI